MKRREFVEGSAALGLLAAFSSIARPAPAFSGSSPQKTTATGNAPVSNPLAPPAHGQLPVAFVVSRGTVMIDLAGPWEVFNSVMIMSRGSSMDDQMPFQTYTVAESTQPVTLGGIKIIPDYTFANAPTPKIVVIPAQDGQTDVSLHGSVRIGEHGAARGEAGDDSPQLLQKSRHSVSRYQSAAWSAVC